MAERNGRVERRHYLGFCGDEKSVPTHFPRGALSHVQVDRRSFLNPSQEFYGCLDFKCMEK